MKRRSTFFAIVTTLLIVGAFAAVGLMLVRRISAPVPGLMGAREKVGIVPIEGVIGLDVQSKDVVEQLDMFESNSTIKAIVVRIISPGGSVGPSQEIYDKIVEVSAKKKVVASLGDVAASGGYYVAAAANKIVSNPGTITGSIGVIAEFPNLEKLFEKIGITQAVVKSGEFKDLGNLNRPITEEERTLLQGVIDDVYEQFLKAVLDGRGMDRKDLLPYADGRIFSGKQALSYGLVDELGGLEAAIRLAGKLGGIKGKPEVVYPERKFGSLLDLLMGHGVDGLLGRFRLPSFHLSYLFVPPIP
jgi:protease-4